jgi:hypothetical protein
MDVSDRGLPAGSADVVAANMHDYFLAGVTAIRDVLSRPSLVMVGGEIVARA